MNMKYMRLLLLLNIAHLCGGLRLVNNGYEDLNVVIQDSIKENDKLIDRIKEIFQEASTLLYKATQQRAYFRSIVINIPKTWTKKDSYRTVSPLSSSTSHIRIGKGNMKTPVTCTHLHYKHFVLKNGVTKWGKHGSVIVHEWGHLRWGLKDEYPTIRRGSRRTWHFYQAGGKWNPVGCSRNMQGYASKSCKKGADPMCDVNNIYNIIGRKCRFCPDLTQPLNASLMSFQYIPAQTHIIRYDARAKRAKSKSTYNVASEVAHFCDKDDPSTPDHLRHDSEALNEQNMYCNGRSAWEIMREHDDFKNENNLPSNADSPPQPEFITAQETADKVRVLVLDTSGSMGGERINALYKASKLMIESFLPDGSWLSMVDFDSNAVLLSPFAQIDSFTTRQSLVVKLPRVGDGGTCIPCGLQLALSTLVTFSQIDSTEESEVILISDGQNGAGDLNTATQSLVDAGVVVHCIAVTQAADARLEEISQRTDGRCFAYTEAGSVSLSAVLSEIIFGGSVSSSSAATTMINDQFDVLRNAPSVITYNIDDGIGLDTVISVISKSISNLRIDVSGPPNATYSKSADQVESLSLSMPGISKPGQYTTVITSSRLTSLEVLVTSKPISLDAEVIRPVVKLSTDQLDFNRTESIPIMYVYLRKGESPIKKANVTAVVDGPDGTRTCELNLLDNGIYPDVTSDDGIYTAFVHLDCQGGNGRHNSKVFVTGDQDTVVTLSTSSESAVLDDERETEEDKATGNFERIAVPDAYTVTNYNLVTGDVTSPGRITDVEVIDIHAGVPSAALTRNYTITWTATGDDFNIGRASLYEMRISSNISLLRYDFMNNDLLNVRGVNMIPSAAGQVERLQMVISTSEAFTSTAYFAIVAIDEVGNRGLVSNIIPITVGETSKFDDIIVVREECTDDCYSVQTYCGRSVTIPNGHVDLDNTATTPGNVAPVVCDAGFTLNGGTSITCLGNGTWSVSVTCIARDNIGEEKLSTTTIGIPAIIGICAGALILVSLSLIIIFLLRRRNQSKLRKYKIKEGSKKEPVENGTKLDTQGKHEPKSYRDVIGNSNSQYEP